MVILGLTGSIGMGKSTAAAALRRLGVPVYDADGTIHRLIRRGGAAVPLVEKAFPGVVKDGVVDRRKLGDLVFADPAALRRLEAILHPLARRAQLGFLAAAARRRARLVVLDIPLLFETRGDRRCDAVALLSAPRMIQEARVLARPGMTPEKLAGIRKRQLPDSEKRRRADFVVPTGLAKREALRRLEAIIRRMRTRTGRHWRPGALGT
jgi:dephospho-CoA kinase